MTFDLMNLSSDKLQRLMKAAKAKVPQNTDDVQAAEYDWKKPKFFSSAELAGLNNLARDFANEIANKYSGFFNAEYTVTAETIDQHYLSDITAKLDQSQSGNYFMGFCNADKNPCGTVVMPTQTAAKMASQLLGGHQSEQSESGRLGELEESLLIDIVSIVAGALPGIHHSLCFKPADRLDFNQLPFKPDGQQVAVEIPLSVKAGQDEDTLGISAVILCDKMTAMTERNNATKKQMTREQITNAIMTHLKQTKVSVEARLASIDLSIDEAMDLQQGDLILLGKSVDQPAQLLLDSKVVFDGKCAQADNRYALVISGVRGKKKLS